MNSSFVVRFARLGLVALVLSGLADPAAAAEAWAVATLKFVYPLGDGSVVLAMTTDPPTCTSTATPKYLLVRAGQNGMTADGAKNILAAALTALAMGTQFQVNFDDSTSNCYVNRAAAVGS